MNSNLISSNAVAEGTTMFRFTKPKGFEYRAGQSIDLTLPSGLMHPFSLVSASHEPELAIATRMRRESAFKNELTSLSAGITVAIEGPFGFFFLHENAARPAVFLVGGIGITPFYSILKDAGVRKLPHHIYMLYANRTPRDAPFVAELEVLANENPLFKIQNVFGIHIDADMVRSFAPTEGQPLYYMAGPKGMVSTMRMLVNELGVSDDDIRSEEFSGY